MMVQRRLRPLLLAAGVISITALLFGLARQITLQPGVTKLSEQTPVPEMPGVPPAAWRRAFDATLENPGVTRITSYPMIDDGPIQGAPLGGLGAGSVGRTYRGDFARWHLAPGEHCYQTVWADQFSVRVARPGADPTATVLMPGRPDSGLSVWNWNYPASGGAYAALYPFSWYQYAPQAAGVTLQTRQFSPVIPHNYQESSYPVALFEWTVANDESTPADVSLLFTWENPLGWGDEEYGVGGGFNTIRRDTLDGRAVLGVVMDRQAPGAGASPAALPWEGQLAIAAVESPGVRLSALGRFHSRGDGAEVWQPWAATGSLPNADDATPTQPGAPIGAALAASVHLEPGESRAVTFVLAWDLPIMRFGGEDVGVQAHGGAEYESWYKRYTEWFGKDGRNAWPIALTGLRDAGAWARAIADWQAPILADTSTPTWYKTALFNELYYLVDGGTIWENGKVGDPTPSQHRFSYLECFDYAFYSTLDVRYYASYAQLMLWPEIEKQEMLTFAETIPQSDPTVYQTTAQEHSRTAIRKVPGAAPHDVGAPFEAPWTRINAYNYQDVSNWKDLNSKFVLLVYRDYVATEDRAFLDAAWPAVRQALDYLKTLDADGDGIPENTGFPDQTYDDWLMEGISAYCGGLWLAALEAGIAMAEIVDAPDAAARYRAWLAQAQPIWEQALWNGQYYDYDTGDHGYHDSVMADQLAGQWYADATGLPPIAPADHIASALNTVYQLNVLGFADGQMGAVNGMRPDGTPDTSSPQSLEVWTGTTYALAAHMLHRGLDEAAWATAYGVYKVTYETKGYWFRTPEAWDASGNFRAAIYMRPQSIWAMQWAIEKREVRSEKCATSE